MTKGKESHIAPKGALVELKYKGPNTYKTFEKEVPNIRKKEIEDLNILNIGFHNINGIKSNKTKLEALVDFAEEEKIDILGICETNIVEREGCWVTKQEQGIHSIWTEYNEEKKKGFGIGLLIKEKWIKHIAKVNKIEAYELEIILIFKRITVLL